MKRVLLAVVLACAAVAVFVIADRLVVTDCERTDSCLSTDQPTAPSKREQVDPFAECRRAAAQADADEQDAVYESCVLES